MNKKFILNETTGIGIIEDDNSNNTLFKTEGNEEEVREVLEKENEIENETTKINKMNKQLEENYITLLVKYISYISSGVVILALIPAFSIVVNEGYTLLNTLSLGALFASLGAFRVITKRMTKPYNKIIKDNEVLYHELDISEGKLEELQNELQELKSNTKMENINLDKLNSIVSQSIIYPEDNNQNIDTLTNTGKVKSLRKLF